MKASILIFWTTAENQAVYYIFQPPQSQMFAVLLMHVGSNLNNPPLLGATQKVLLHIPVATYEPSENSGLGITNPLIRIKEIAFLNVTSSILRGTLSAYNDKPYFDERWLEYSSTISFLLFLVAFLNTSAFCSLCCAVNCPTWNHHKYLSNSSRNLHGPFLNTAWPTFLLSVLMISFSRSINSCGFF